MSLVPLVVVSHMYPVPMSLDVLVTILLFQWYLKNGFAKISIFFGMSLGGFGCDREVEYVIISFF